MANNNMIRVGGLWSNTTRSGGKYLSGSLGNARIVILPNDRKREGKNDPDYTLFIAPQEQRENVPATTVTDDHDIPF